MPRTLLLAAGMLAILLNQARGGEWVTLKNCQLIPNEYNDGDSFHVSHDGREYVFRLYFADAPETDDSYSDRVVEQAEHFGISSAEAIKVGINAKYATEQLLEEPFDVVTRWQDGGGRSKLGRSYAFVFIEGRDGRKTADLAAILIANGLARAHGAKAKPPWGGLKAAELHQIYLGIEAEALEARKGGWQRKGEALFGAYSQEKMIGKRVEAEPKAGSESESPREPKPPATSKKIAFPDGALLNQIENDREERERQLEERLKRLHQ